MFGSVQPVIGGSYGIGRNEYMACFLFLYMLRNGSNVALVTFIVKGLLSKYNIVFKCCYRCLEV